MKTGKIKKKKVKWKFKKGQKSEWVLEWKFGNNRDSNDGQSIGCKI